jgi:hypothetical protein
VLRQVAEGVLIHQSEFCQSNAVVVHGRAGVLLIDPGVLGHELGCGLAVLAIGIVGGDLADPVEHEPSQRPCGCHRGRRSRFVDRETAFVFGRMDGGDETDRRPCAACLFRSRAGAPGQGRDWAAACGEVELGEVAHA